MKALVGAFNQEKALVMAFSMIVKTGCETDGALHSTSRNGLSVIMLSSCLLPLFYPDLGFLCLGTTELGFSTFSLGYRLDLHVMVD